MPACHRLIAALMLGLFAALPAMAEMRTCRVDFNAGDHRLRVERTGDGTAVSGTAYILVLLDRDPALRSWPTGFMIPGSGRLDLSLNFAEPGSTAYRWRFAGAHRVYEATGVGGRISIDWADLDARLAGRIA